MRNTITTVRRPTRSFRHQLCIVTVVAGLASPAIAGGFDSGSDGSDGAFMPLSDVEIDLALADVGSWDTPGAGNGVYDADRWIVVFKYTTINIPPGATVTFFNHPSGAPVIWLSQGDVVIEGTVSLNGDNGTFITEPYQFSEGGPGGFSGGSAGITGFPQSHGFGPGGGNSGGSYNYGNQGIFPLIGGSGGRGAGSETGGAGAGAILVASSGSINLTGLIEANGGGRFTVSGRGGSGGGVRLVGNVILGNGSITALGGLGSSGVGRVRIEAFDVTGFTGSTNPLATIAGPGPVVQDSLVPTLRVTFVDDQPVPQDPVAGVLTKEVVAENDIVTLTIEATNIMPSTTVTVKVSPAHGDSFTVTSTPLVGSMALSTATATVNLPSFPADIQLRASF